MAPQTNKIETRYPMGAVRSALLGLVAVAFGIPANAQQPLPKVGSCPSGFYASGKYCVPFKDKSKPAMLRGGQCPSGYYTSGKYCVAISEKSKLAIPKDGPCPTGYYASGGYCLQIADQKR